MNNQIIFSIQIFVTKPWSGSICGVLCAAAQSVSKYQLAKFVCLFVWWAGIRSLRTNSPVAVAITVIFLAELSSNSEKYHIRMSMDGMEI